MSTPIDLKALERKAFRRTYQDGLWEIQAGGILVSFSAFAFNIFPGDVFTTIEAFGIYLLGAAASSLIFWIGKKYITVPRMGLVNFGPYRRKRKRDLLLALSVIVGVQVLFVLIQFGLLAFPGLRANVAPFLGDARGLSLLVAVAAVIFVTPGLLLIVYFMEIPGGYISAAVISSSIFLMIITNQAWWMVLGGVLILVPGVVRFVRFLKQYPLPPEDVSRASQ